MTAESINLLFRMLTLSQVLLITTYFLFVDRTRLGILIAATAAAFGGYLILPFAFDAGVWWFWIPGVFATMIPSLLWLLGYWSFRDQRDVPLWLMALTALYVVLAMVPEPSTGLGSLIPEAFAGLLFDLFPQAAKLLLVIHVVYMTIADEASDLVAARQRLRRPIAGGAASLAALVIVVEIWSGEAVHTQIEAMGAILMFVLAIATGLAIFRSRLDLDDATRAVTPPVGADTRTAPEVEQVVTAMKEQRLYAQHGLTLAMLSDQVKIPVHRLRETIHQHLKHRHFNQFVNEYRIDEAARRLVAEPSLPVLSIALDVGFQSLSTFNKAFRDLMGCTPTEFRAQND